MGGCIGTSNPKQRDKFDQQPADTPKMATSDCPVLAFKALLTKLRLKRCGFYKHVGIKIDFGKHHAFELKPKYVVNEAAQWDLYHEFGFKSTQYELRKEFMGVVFVDEKGNVIGNLKINLFLLATGPYHQDFAIDLVQCKEARITFNLKISQFVTMRMKVNEAEMIPADREFPGDIFAFSLKSIMGDLVAESELSYRYLIAFDEEKAEGSVAKSVVARRIERKQTFDVRPVSELTKMRKLNSIGVENETQIKKYDKQSLIPRIRWKRQGSVQMPSIETVVPLYELHGASLNLTFFTFVNKSPQFSSQCFISFNKLVTFQFRDVFQTQSKKHFQERQVQLQTKLWDHGRQTGKGRIRMTFVVERHLKQLQLCVRTQRGVLQASPVVGETSGAARVPEELQQLQRITNQIQNQYVQLSGSTSSFRNEKWERQVNSRLLSLNLILKRSSKDAQLMFSYQDERALMQGQRRLIQFAKRVRALLDEDKEQIAHNCWVLLSNLVRRSELNLSYIGFSNEQVQEALAGSPSDHLLRKREVALDYYLLLIDFLERTFKSLQAYNYESQKEFAQLFCAYAYFRLPRFRNEVLTAITRTQDPEVEEWRGAVGGLREEGELSTGEQSTFSLMFDWDNKFYKVVQTEEQFKQAQAKLSELLRTSSWEERMKKRGGAFFAFVRYWAAYIEDIAQKSKYIQWRYFPGYSKILQSFMVEMKTKPIAQYSDVLKRAAAGLLANEKLLNPFVLIVFRKTNEHDQPAVIKAFELVSYFMASVGGRGRSLPASFDLKLLLRGIRAVVQGSGSYAIGKVLLLVYDHYNVLPIDFRLEIANYLLTKVFFKLFLHWSHNVRTIFHHLLFIRIYHQASRPLEQLDPKDQDIHRSNPEFRSQLVSRYRKLLLILQNAQHYQHKIGGRRIDKYEKQTYKKMKKKIQEKRKQVQSGGDTHKPQKRDEEEYGRQLMLQLGQPKLESYQSEVLSRNLKVVLERSKQTPMKSREEVIVKRGSEKKVEPLENTGLRRKINIFDGSFQDELTPLREEEVAYVQNSLEQYHKISESFIKQVEKNKDSVPIVRLELSLDEKEIRPSGLSEHDQW